MAKIVINENMINNDITWNNLKELESCHNKMTRYRIHRVVMTSVNNSPEIIVVSSAYIRWNIYTIN